MSETPPTQDAPPRPKDTEGIHSVTIYRNAAGRQIEELRDLPEDGVLAMGPARYIARVQGAVEIGPKGAEQHIPVPFMCIIPARDIKQAYALLQDCLNDQGPKAMDAAKKEYERQFNAQRLTHGITPGMRVPNVRRPG